MDGHEERNASQPEAVSSLTTDNLRRLKRSRGGLKSFVSKTRETLESIFAREEILSNFYLEELKKKVHALRQSQDEIREKDFQSEDEVPEDDLESEIEETSEFHSELELFIYSKILEHHLFKNSRALLKNKRMPQMQTKQ